MTKAIKKQALGRGLSALLKDPENDIKSVEDKNADKVIELLTSLSKEYKAALIIVTHDARIKEKFINQITLV